MHGDRQILQLLESVQYYVAIIPVGMLLVFPNLSSFFFFFFAIFIFIHET